MKTTESNSDSLPINQTQPAERRSITKCTQTAFYSHYEVEIETGTDRVLIKCKYHLTLFYTFITKYSPFKELFMLEENNRGHVYW